MNRRASFSDSLKTLPQNVFSGFVVSLIALPLGLGLAIASEAPPLAGIISAVAGGIVVSVFGGSYVTIAGPGNGLVIVLLAAITTLGEGGALATDSADLALKVRRLSLHGITKDGWDRYAGGKWEYDVLDLGFKYNMPDIAASFGLWQLSNMKHWQNRRKEMLFISNPV